MQIQGRRKCGNSKSHGNPLPLAHSAAINVHYAESLNWKEENVSVRKDTQLNTFVKNAQASGKDK
jgi:hypothetical protein